MATQYHSEYLWDGRRGPNCLTDLLEGLENGRVSRGDAIRAVRAFPFPEGDDKGAPQRTAEDSTGDPQIPPDNSFYAISRAYTLGRISRRQHEALADAAAGVPGSSSPPA